MTESSKEPNVNGLPLSIYKGICTAGDTPLRAAGTAPRKAFAPVVQIMTRPHPWFKRVALDSKWQYVCADHIRFLTKKRHRVDGVRVQGYIAGGLKVEVLQ